MKTVTRIKVLVALVFSILLSATVMAQERNDADWVASFGEDVIWQRVTSFGMLVVATTDGLHGVDPATGNVLWTKNELADLPESGYLPIDGSPFIQLSSADENPTVFIIEPFEGTLVFNSKKAGIDRVKDSYVLSRNLCLLIQGYQAGNNSPSLYSIDLASGKKLWEKHDEFGMLTAFRELGGDKFLLATLWNIYKINSRTGEIYWKQAMDPEAAELMEKMKGVGNLLKNLAENSIKPGDVLADFYMLEDDKDFIFGFESKSTSTKKTSDGKTVTTVKYKSGYQRIDLADGKFVWTEGVSFAGKRGQIIFDKDGLIVCPDAGLNTMVNMVDYSTGEKKWGKNGRGFKVKGGVIDYKYTNEGILLILAKDGSSGSNPAYMVNMLDPAGGTLKFDKYAKLKGNIEQIELLDDGLFYSTDREANILNLSTGVPKFAKSIKTGSNMNVSGDDKIYVFSPGSKALFEIDKNTESFEQLSTEDIKFQGKETPNALELREDGVIILGMQNIALVGFDGSHKFQEYYPAPTISGIMKALNAAMAVRAAYIGIAASMTAAAVGATTAKYADDPIEKEIGVAVTEAYGELGAAGFSYAKKYMKAVNQRFKATANSPDFIFMMTVGDGRKDNRLIRVNKDTGEVMDFVSLGKDKKPSYEVDNISNQIYYRKEPENISCFKFAD
ncbi:MAG: PQQ-binding-like beta-propeller repeat protein [Bacteroidales bacterium]|nr:PQQ-binding-like beta-propeller repeat protein [Bacteroidales bacterium]